MIIDKAEVIVTSPDRNFVTLKLTTDDGLTGLGDATLNGRELAVVAYLREHVVPLLIGRDAPKIEDTWQFLYRCAYWRRGPVTMAAIAAVDMALWDIKGKAAGMPVYQLLGGASRNGLMAYGHASGKELPELFDSIRAHQEQGYQAIRVQTGVPGLKAIYGIAAQSRRRASDGVRPRARAARREPGRGGLGHPRLPPPPADAFRSGAERVRPRHPAAARRPPPDDPDPGRAAGQVPRAVRPVLARGLHAGREPGSAAPGAPAHHDTARDRRDLQHDLGLQGLISDQLIDYVRGAVTHMGGITR